MNSLPLFFALALVDVAPVKLPYFRLQPAIRTAMFIKLLVATGRNMDWPLLCAAPPPNAGSPPLSLPEQGPAAAAPPQPSQTCTATLSQQLSTPTSSTAIAARLQPSTTPFHLATLNPTEGSPALLLQPLRFFCLRMLQPFFHGQS